MTQHYSDPRRESDPHVIYGALTSARERANSWRFMPMSEFLRIGGARIQLVEDWLLVRSYFDEAKALTDAREGVE